jgi:hypothetical protein
MTLKCNFPGNSIAWIRSLRSGPSPTWFVSDNFFLRAFSRLGCMLAACWYVHTAYADAWAVRDHLSSPVLCGKSSSSMRYSTCPLHVCRVFVSAASQAFACHCLVNLLPRVARCCYFILPVSMSCAASPLPPVSACLFLFSGSSSSFPWFQPGPSAALAVQRAVVRRNIAAQSANAPVPFAPVWLLRVSGSV